MGSLLVNVNYCVGLDTNSSSILLSGHIASHCSSNTGCFFDSVLFRKHFFVQMIQFDPTTNKSGNDFNYCSKISESCIRSRYLLPTQTFISLFSLKVECQIETKLSHTEC